MDGEPLKLDGNRPEEIANLLALFDENCSTDLSYWPRTALSTITRYDSEQVYRSAPAAFGDCVESGAEWETSTGHKFRYTHTRADGRLIRTECVMSAGGDPVTLSYWSSARELAVRLGARKADPPIAPPAMLNEFIDEILGREASAEDKSLFTYYYFIALAGANLGEVMIPMWTENEIVVRGGSLDDC